MIAYLHTLHKNGDKAGLKAGLVFLGLYSDVLAADRSHELPDAVKAKVESLIVARIAARGQKNWAESDRLRDQLLEMGILIMDSKSADGTLSTTWEVKR